MNPNETGPALTLDETIRLAFFLAERGHAEALFSIVGVLAGEISSTTRVAAEATW